MQTVARARSESLINKYTGIVSTYVGDTNLTTATGTLLRSLIAPEIQKGK